MKPISKAHWFTIVSFGIGFLLPALGILFPDTFFSNQAQISQTIKSFGLFGPLIFILISIIPIIFTPLNHGVFALVGGFLFGPWIGFLLNWTSKSIGTIITFSIGRKLGQSAINKFLKSEDLSQYNKIFNQHPFLIFIGFMINDTLSYLAGISNLPTKSFLKLILPAHILPTLTLAYIGSGISLKDPVFILLSLVILSLTSLYFYIRSTKSS